MPTEGTLADQRSRSRPWIWVQVKLQSKTNQMRIKVIIQLILIFVETLNWSQDGTRCSWVLSGEHLKQICETEKEDGNKRLIRRQQYEWARVA